MPNPAYYSLPAGFRSNTVSKARLLQLHRRGTVNAIKRCLQMQFALSQKEVPRESERLAQSGRKVPPSLSDDLGNRITGHVVYGGPGIPYAARIHEEVTWNFKVPGTKAKYVEDPLKAIATFFAAVIADEVHASLARSLPRI
jgi:hypothetical protein